MSKYDLYLPAKGNTHYGALRFGYAHAPNGARLKDGYDQLDVIDTLDNTDLSSYKERWCEMEFITPSKESDTWLDRCLLKDTKCEDIGILLIMKEGKSLHRKSIRLRNKSGTHIGSYKVALYNKKTDKIMFITVVCSNLNLCNPEDHCCKTKIDGWYQRRTPTGLFQIPAGDITFWQELKKILC